MKNKKEIWVDVIGFKGFYVISNYGVVKSLDRVITFSNGRVYNYKGKIRVLSNGTGGYYGVNLSKNGKARRADVHRLVYESFVGEIPKNRNMVVDHINNDLLDNRLENLQLITQRENVSKDKKNCTSDYTGVYKRNKGKKWQSTIKLKGKTIYLGSYDKEIDASKAYQDKLKELNYE